MTVRGQKCFAGEYACHGKGYKRNHFNAALCEAAFMTGLERNADIVRMATYAPLFAHVEGWQWRPDMIWFDNLRSVPTASYYVQQLYGTYKGARVLPLTMAGKPVAGAADQHGLFASAALDESGHYIIKVANTSSQPREVKFNFVGMKKKASLSDVRIIYLRAADKRAENTLDRPDAVKPYETSAKISGHDFSAVVQPESFAVYIVR